MLPLWEERARVPFRLSVSALHAVFPVRLEHLFSVGAAVGVVLGASIRVGLSCEGIFSPLVQSPDFGDAVKVRVIAISVVCVCLFVLQK